MPAVRDLSSSFRMVALGDISVLITVVYMQFAIRLFILMTILSCLLRLVRQMYQSEDTVFVMQMVDQNTS